MFLINKTCLKLILFYISIQAIHSKLMNQFNFEIFIWLSLKMFLISLQPYIPIINNKKTIATSIFKSVSRSLLLIIYLTTNL
jgi:hypothetical protein